MENPPDETQRRDVGRGLRVGPTIVFEGATHARTRAGLIVEQRDYWDLVSSLAASLPILRSVYASLAPHLG